MDGVAVLLLGPVAAQVDGRPVDVGPPRRRAVLAALAVHDGPLSVERLVALLWGDAPPPTAATMVHGAVAGLRRTLGAGSVVTRDGGYALPGVGTDVGRVEGLLAGAAVPDVDAWAEALGEWRGPELDGLDHAFARAAADRFAALRLDCTQRWAQAALAAGHHREVPARLAPVVAAHPLCEQLVALLMAALHRGGRRSEALAVGRRLRVALADELGVGPGPEVRRAEEAILRRAPAGSGLPARTDPFVGRRRERGEVAALVDAHRLVTLTGPGGTGKTRLALEVAARSPYEAVFVDLVASTTTGADVEDAVAGALGVRPEPGAAQGDAIVAALSGRDVLLVVDNCEHVVDACAAAFGALLATTPVRVLATGREALALPGEHVYPVAPLACARPGAPAEEIRRCEAVVLFLARAAAARPGFRADGRVDDRADGPVDDRADDPADGPLDDLAAVLDVCRRLDGLPLAIELAAARVATMTVADLATRLDERFRLLDGTVRGMAARHRTLAATVAWSTDLLSPAERALFGRLGVFPAGFDLAAAEAVGAGPDLPAGEVAAALARLVAGNVVQLGGDGRYRMLATTRAFARARTGTTADETAARHVTALAAGLAPRLQGPGSGPLLRRLDAETPNLRAALTWAFGPDGDSGVGVALAGALWHHWDLRGARAEGLRWTAAALAVVDDPAGRLPLLSAAALLHVGRAEFDATDAAAREQLTLARRLGDRASEGDALGMVATTAWARGAFDRARQLYEDAIAASLDGGDRWRAAMEEAQLARLHRDRGEPDAAHAAARRAAGHAGHVGEDLARGLALDVQASLEARWGDPRSAADLTARAREHYRAVGYREGEASALQQAGRLAAASGDDAAARRAFGQALRLYRRIGHRAGVAAAHEGLADTVRDPVAGAGHRAAAAGLRAEIGISR
ncbi:BTAD domain-containing putative transcriptional regulator [Pseudonocardia sp.]|uniref:BTAD domain-containing putative transcriptional regulator n=1 Tax=Pseudonocardia sp. TaxID=60912 RepID=UPI003D1273C5